MTEEEMASRASRAASRDHSLPATSAEPSAALVAAVGEAMDTHFGWSINLTRLVDGVSTYTLTFPGYEPEDFESHEDAYEVLGKRLGVARAKLVLAAIEPTIAPLREIAALARELVSPAGMVNRGADRGLVVIEKADKSDPHYRLCAALASLP